MSVAVQRRPQQRIILAACVGVVMPVTQDIPCPKCKRVVTTQTQYVTLYIDARFKCRFCDHEGVLRWQPKTVSKL